MEYLHRQIRCQCPGERLGDVFTMRASPGLSDLPTMPWSIVVRSGLTGPAKTQTFSETSGHGLTFKRSILALF